MNSEEALKICRFLARKYNDQSEYDDLVSEGILAIYEMMDQGVKEKKLLFSHAQRSMHDYYNIKRSPVHVPAGGMSHSMSKDQDTEGWTESAMYNALYGDVVELEENVLQVESSEETYARQEWFAHVASVAITCVSEEEWKILRMRYWEDMTQDEVGEVFGQNKMWVSRKEKMALEKVRNKL